MTERQMHQFMDTHTEEFLRFDRIPPEERLSGRPDLHLFRRLDELFPGTEDIIVGAARCEICLGIRPEQLAEIATPEMIIQFLRCGLGFDVEDDYLYMIV